MRTALAGLAAERLVQFVPYRGARVSALSIAEIEDLQALRGALESEAVRLLHERHGARWPDTVLAPIEASIATLCAWWRDHAAPTLLWDDATEFVTSAGDRTPWEGDVRLLDGRLISCRFRPLTGGATLIVFRTQGAVTYPSLMEATAMGVLSA